MIDALTKKWIRARADETAAEQGCTFSMKGPERVRMFFRTFLQHSKGQWAGKPFELLDWQFNDLVCPLFGWRKPDGTRRFQIAFIEIPKKNGKSTFAAGIGLYLLVGDGEPGAEIYSTAVTRDQAGIVHNEAMTMVEASRALKSYLKVNKSNKVIHFPQTNSKYRPLASDADSNEGLNAHGIIIDELHAWKGERGRNFFEAIQYAGRARAQPLMLIITTAGDDVATVCYEKLEYARDILSGVNKDDTRFFAYVKEATSKDDLEDPETWRRVNPSMGITIREDAFACDLAEAKKSPTAWASFKRYSFNIWTSGSNPAICREDWAACRDDFAEDLLLGQECWAGLDLSRVSDMTSLALLFKSVVVSGETYLMRDGTMADFREVATYRLLVYSWLPEGSAREGPMASEYRAWAKAGRLTLTDGDVTDYAVVERKLIELAGDGETPGKFRLVELAFDPYFAEELTQRFQDATGVKRVAFAQTIANFAPPTSEFERLVIAHQLRHDGNPVLSWQVGHVEFKTDQNNNKRPIKPGGNSVKKIDGVVATIMALGRAMIDRAGGGFGCGA